MPISLKKSSFYAEAKDQLNSTDKAYFRAKTKRKVHNMILKRFSEIAEDDRMLRSLIAYRLGVHRSQVTRWLASPSNNMTLDTLSDLMLAMNREVDVDSIEIGLNAGNNYAHPTSTLGTTGLASSVNATTQGIIVNSYSIDRSLRQDAGSPNPIVIVQ